LKGETLADRLRRGPLPLPHALEVGAQIAEALDAAHKHGVVHRDLKPGNVMLTTGGAGRSGVTSAKLLDFGLAKLAAHGERPALAGGASVPTQAAPVTAEGTILGTLQYMAPEQLEGKEADARTDLWALGAILYEMVTGKRAFEGESQASLIGNIMNAEPAALATVQPLTPPSLERVVKKCLAKAADDRWDTAHDVADLLRWTRDTSSAASAAVAPSGRPPGVRRALTVAGVVAGVLAGAGLMWLLRPAPTAPQMPLTRVSLDVRPSEELNAGGRWGPDTSTPGGSRTALTWTPDGRALVFTGRRGGAQQLYVRRLDAQEARPLPNTEGAQVPAVSVDGQWVAFWEGGAIRKVLLGGGPVMELAAGLAAPPWGLVWDTEGRLFFGRDDRRIWTIPPGGPPRAVTTLAEAEVAHVLPWPLPGGRVLLYTVRKRIVSWGDEEVVAQTLATGERKALLTDAADARYVPPGHLVFMRRGVLFAVPFDAERLELGGTPVAVLDGVAQALTSAAYDDISGAGQFALATPGTLAWVPGPVMPFAEKTLVTVDRRGQVAPVPSERRSYGSAVRVSPDGRRLALVVNSLTGRGLWVLDVDRETLVPLADGEVSGIAWSPEGRRLAFGWIKNGRRSLAVQTADGTAPPRVLAEGEFWAQSFTPDGRHVVAIRGNDIVDVRVDDGNGLVEPVIQSAHFEGGAALSPDGRWLAYVSDASGRFDVYVQPYPGPGPAEMVSTEGGANPAWHWGGREIFFTSVDSAGTHRMMAVDFEPGPPPPLDSGGGGHRAVGKPRIGRPRLLFAFNQRTLSMECHPARCYDVATNGQRFYATELRAATAPASAITHVNLVQNWFEELKAKVPAGGAK
jgi:serine/threonine-protein kinase